MFFCDGDRLGNENCLNESVRPPFFVAQIPTAAIVPNVKPRIIANKFSLFILWILHDFCQFYNLLTCSPYDIFQKEIGVEMEISYLGLSAFKIRGRQAVLITDPYNASIGFKFPKVEADIITVSHDHFDHNATSAVGGSPFIVAGPGEYDIKGIRILGIPTTHDVDGGTVRGKNTIYQIIMDNLVLVHCGDLGHKLTTEQIEEVGNPDVLFVPVGGDVTIDSHTAAELVTTLEPRIVVPMHYNYSNLSQEFFGRLAPVSNFLKEMGKEGVKSISKLSITKDKLPQETEIILLE